MNLREFLSRMQIPQYKEIYNGNAGGFIRLTHPEIELETKEGDKKCTVSDCHTEYVAFLGIVRDNPNSTFGELYREAMDQYGFPAHAPIADLHLGMLEFFERIGAIQVDGKVRSRQMGLFYVFGIPERAGDAKFSLCDEGLEAIQVLSATPKDSRKEQAFKRYFPTG